MGRIFSLSLWFALLAPVLAIADAPAVGDARVTPNPLTVLLGLALVVGMILAMGWLMRRLGAGGWLPGRGMRALATLPLGGRERIVLVEVGTEQLLLGVAPGRVNLLARYRDPVVTPRAPSSSAGFAERLREQLVRRGDST